MEAELKNLIDENGQWKVKKIAKKEFLVVFPNKQILDAFSKSVGFTMALYHSWATVSPSTRDHAASSMLQMGWVQMYNVPNHARTVEAVTLIAELGGDVMVVDELSLIKDGPVRVRIHARDIEKIRGYVEFFVDGVGYEVKFVPEFNQKSQETNSSTPTQQDNGGQNEDEDDDLLDSEEERPRRGRDRGRGDKTSRQSQKGSGSVGR
ncbi:unnamed protein product [Urochloa humidicola]